MKNMLMISYPFPPNATAGAIRSYRFARYLPDYDWKIDVITIKKRGDLFQDVSLLKNLDPEYISIHRTSIWDPWLWLRGKNAKNRFLNVIRNILMKIFSFPDHMIFWIPSAVRIGLNIQKKKKIDILYSSSPPHSTHLAALILSKINGTPWVADFRDPWTVNNYPGDNLFKKIAHRIEKRLERIVLNNASIIIANTNTNLKNLLEDNRFLNKEKIKWLPNSWEDIRENENFQSLEQKINDKDDKLIIVHAGTFYPQFKPYGLLYALNLWKQKGNNKSSWSPIRNKLKVIILGGNDPETKKVVEELELKDVVQIIPWVGLSEARLIMNQADLLWASLGTETNSLNFIPSKIFEYIAAKKPILGFFPEGEASDLIRATGTGVIFNSDEPYAIIEFLNKLISPKNEKKIEWYQPKKEIIDYYHAENICKKFADIIESTS